MIGGSHIRVNMGTNEIHLKVLDYYGGSAYTYSGGFHYGPGRLIKTGEVLKGTVRLKLLDESTNGTPAKNLEEPS
jgi:hypothetical protein